jgi:ankyrin repeat protein
MVRQDGKTALMWASDQGETDVVELLLEAGANKTIQDKVGSIFK